MRILVVEDELAIARVLDVYLKREKYETQLVHSGAKALEAFDRFQPHLVLLDVMMPDIDGWDVLRYIRDKCACPVILLTSLSNTEHKLYGLGLGADDYVTKPFVAEEVLARINVVLRRSGHVMERKHVRYFGSLKIDFQSHQVFLNGAEVSLSPRDLAVFLLLAEHPRQVFSREQLIEQVWGMDYDGSDRAVDLSIKRIRKTLENWPISEGEIRTMHRIGYQFMIHD